MTPPARPDLSAEYLADLAVDNGEGGAQMMIADQMLRRSMVANVRKQMQRLEAHARADERRKARAELIAELEKPIEAVGELEYQLDKADSIYENSGQRMAPATEFARLVQEHLISRIPSTKEAS
jgi:hypothetical protein